MYTFFISLFILSSADSAIKILGLYAIFFIAFIYNIYEKRYTYIGTIYINTRTRTHTHTHLHIDRAMYTEIGSHALDGAYLR